jgi:glycerol uptake facilitator-like aquaporin
MLDLRWQFAEFYGTFVLSFAVAVSNGTASVVGPALFVAIVSSGMISGGHFNPAVTFACMLTTIGGEKDPDAKRKKIINYCGFFLV